MNVICKYLNKVHKISQLLALAISDQLYQVFAPDISHQDAG